MKSEKTQPVNGALSSSTVRNSNASIGIDAPVAQERPTLTGLFDFAEIALGEQNFFSLAAGVRNELAERTGDK